MKEAKDLDYTIHHLCIYDKEPRDHMWPFLRWHHGITGYFYGDTYHVTGEGHADYTFLGCGGRAFQVQLEAPPYQFKYERQWYSEHGEAYNHICWIVNDARASYDQLQRDGATVVMEFEEFPTYDGFVVKDPEGRWVEIMEYTDPVMRVQEFTNQPSGQCGLQMIGFSEVAKDVERMADWYVKALGMRKILERKDGDNSVVYLTDKFYNAKERNTVMILTTPRTKEERSGFARHGPFINGIVYQAIDVQQAHDDAVAAGLASVTAPATDELTGALTAQLREANGNGIILRDTFQPQ